MSPADGGKPWDADYGTASSAAATAPTLKAPWEQDYAPSGQADASADTDRASHSTLGDMGRAFYGDLAAGAGDIVQGIGDVKHHVEEFAQREDAAHPVLRRIDNALGFTPANADASGSSTIAAGQRLQSYGNQIASNVKNPNNPLVETAGTIGSFIPATVGTLGAAALGTLVGGPPGGAAAGLAAGSSLFGAQGEAAGRNAGVAEVAALTPQQKAAVPYYQQRLAAGRTPEQATADLSAHAANRGALVQGGEGLALGALGEIPGVGALGRMVTSKLARPLGQTAARIVGKGVGEGIAFGGINAAGQAVSNVANPIPTPVSTDVGKSFASGLLPGFLLGAGRAGVAALHRPTPFPEAKPGSLADAANVLHRNAPEPQDAAAPTTGAADSGTTGATPTHTLRMQPPAVPWVNTETGETRTPAADEVVAAFHRLQDTQDAAAANGTNLTVSPSALSKAWGVPSERLRSLLNVAIAERKKGITTHDAEQRAAEIVAQNGANDTFAPANASLANLAEQTESVGSSLADARARLERLRAAQEAPITPPAGASELPAPEPVAAAQPAVPEPATAAETAVPPEAGAPSARADATSAPADQAGAEIPRSSSEAPDTNGVVGETTPNVGERQAITQQREASAQTAGARASAAVDANAEPPVTPQRVVKASVPLGAGMSADGATLYVDHRIPEVLDVPRDDGSIAKVRLYSAENPSVGGLAVHEGNEFPQMEAGKTYQDAHNENANHAEDAYYQQKYGVTRAAVDKALTPYLDAARKQGANAADVPPDLDHTPYTDSNLAHTLAPDAHVTPPSTPDGRTLPDGTQVRITRGANAGQTGVLLGPSGGNTRGVALKGSDAAGIHSVAVDAFEPVRAAAAADAIKPTEPETAAGSAAPAVDDGAAASAPPPLRTAPTPADIDAITSRFDPPSAFPAPDAKGFVTTKSVDGRTVRVRQGQVAAGGERLRMFDAMGKSAGVIHRANLDPTGEKRAALAQETAGNPLSDVITRRNGSPFATQSAATRELNRQALHKTHTVVRAEKVAPGAKGFVIVNKEARRAHEHAAAPEAVDAIEPVRAAANTDNASHPHKRATKNTGTEAVVVPGDRVTVTGGPQEGKAAIVVGRTRSGVRLKFEDGKQATLSAKVLQRVAAKDADAAVHTTDAGAKAEAATPEVVPQAALPHGAGARKTTPEGARGSEERLSAGSPNNTTPRKREQGIPATVTEPLARFRNDQPLKRDPDYKAAKAGDAGAAVRLVKRLAGPLVQDAKTRFGADTIFVAPHAEEATGKNAIPAALSEALAAGTHGSAPDDITQTNRVHHTGAGMMERLIARPEFAGDVVKGGKYVLVDDVSTSGGTFADLSDYIRRNGGEVVGAVSLVNAARGGKLAAEPHVLRRLEGRHGDVIREQLGIEPRSLTAEEAGYLTGFRSADEIRNRATAAAQQRSARLRAKGIQGLEPPAEGSTEAEYRAVAGEAPGAPARQQGAPVSHGENGAAGLPVSSESTRHGTTQGLVNRETPPKDGVSASGKAEPTALKKTATIDDFGQKLGGARKDAEPSVAREMSDSDIRTQPLSKIWPAAEVDAITDPFTAAVAYATRAEIPPKPRKSYKLDRWVQKVQAARELARLAQHGDLTPEKLTGRVGLKDFGAKVDLLQKIPREQWGRIGDVAEQPDAHTYGPDGEKIPKPRVMVQVDGRWESFNGAKNVNDALEAINARLGSAPTTKPLQFEIRGNTKKGDYFINKKGDGEYRRLKTFTDLAEARAYLKSNHEDLVKAWEAVKDRDNVTKADMRNADNRDRVGPDYRDGKDVTPEQFGENFGFRGVEFGNWVKQGGNTAERQGLLNQAYDALMDLANLIGVPPRAMSLDGSLGLGLGSRGHGWASAHFEPDRLVINLTKTRGAGALAHEWFHALDNYFARMRGVPKFTGDQNSFRRQAYVTYRPEPEMVNDLNGRHISRAQYDEMVHADPRPPRFFASEWHVDPNHAAAVRPVVEKAFADVVNALNASPMHKRALTIDKGKEGGYWSRIVERAARSFENYVIARMDRQGISNDYLANVRQLEAFNRNPERYPYLRPEEVKPVAEAFDNLFATLETRKGENGNVALFSRGPGTGGIDREQLDRVVASAKRRWGKNQPDVAVVDTPEGLPAAAKGDSGYQRAEGYYDGKKVWLVASNLPSAARARQVLAHEAVGHYGVDRIVQDAYGKDAWDKVTQSVTRLDREHLGGKVMQDVLAETHRRYPDADATTFAKEAIAVMAEHGIRNGIIDRVVAAVRQYLRKIMPNLDLSAAEVRQLLARSDRLLGEGTARAQREQVRMVAAHAFDKTPDTFYSALTEAMARGKGAPKKADAAAWKQWLDGAQRRGEFKGAEREWTGLDQWLDEHKGPVTRAELTDFVRQNQVHVQEVVHGDEPPIDAADIRENENGGFDLVNDAGDLATAPERPTKFDQYTLPGGKNYRELLLTTGLRGGEFHSQHFDEPNIVAHVRFNDRVGPDGAKIMHVEEVQSDLHQAGRKNGYADKPDLERPVVVFNAKTGENVARFRDGKEAEAYIAARDPKLEPLDYVDTTANGGSEPDRVPNAPFKKTEQWSMLAMKRVLRYAADHGYDKVTWTTGEQQAARYDQSRQLKSVHVDAQGDGAPRIVTMNTNRGPIRLFVDKDGRVTSSTASNARLRGQGLDDVIGKELATKVMTAPDNTTLAGDDLKFGGEGMKAFYDRMLPNELNKYVKQWGAKVGETQIETQAASTRRSTGHTTPAQTLNVHSIDVTPAMRDSVRRGQPLFAKTTRSLTLDDPAPERKTALRDMAAIPQPDTLSRLSGHTLREAAGREFNAARAAGPVTMMDGADVQLSGRGWREVRNHSGDRRVLDLIPGIRDMMARAVPLWEDAVHDPNRPNVKAFRHYGVKVKGPSGDYYARFVVRVGKDGRFHYDHDAVSAEAIESEGPAHQRIPEPNRGEDAASLAKNRLAQWWNRVKDDPEPGGDRSRGAFSKAAPADPSTEPHRALDSVGNVLREGDPKALQRVKDWLADKFEDVRPKALMALQTGHVIELMRDKAPFKGTVDRYEHSMQQLDADRQLLLNGAPDADKHPNDMLKKGAGPISAELQRFAHGHGFAGMMNALRHRFTPEAKRTFDVMHKATIAGVDPARDYERLTIENARGDRIPWTMENRKARIKLLHDLAMERGGDAWADREKLGDEVRYLRALPRLEKQREADYKRLKNAFDALPAEGKRMYLEQRDWYASFSAEMEKALIKNIDAYDMADGLKQKLAQLMRMQFESARREGVYFPLNRNGDYWVAYRTPDGQNGFEMFETMDAQRSRERELKAAGNRIDATGRRDKNAKAKDAPTGTFVRDAIDIMAKAKVSEKVQDQVYQAYLKLLPDLSMRKHAIHRGNVVGYDKDVPRTFSKFAFHGAYQLAKLRHAQDMQTALDAMGVSLDNWRKRNDQWPGAKSPELEKFMEDALAKYEANPEAERAAADTRDVGGLALALDEAAKKVAAAKTGRQAAVEREAWAGLAKRWEALPDAVRRSYTLDAMDRFGLHEPKSTAEIAKMDTLLGALRKRNEWIMNPTDQQLANMVNSIGFMYYLGASPASAITNLTQVAQLTLPYLGARHGWGRASRTLWTAWRDAVRTNGNMGRLLTDADEHKAFIDMQQRGIFSRSQAHTVIGLAEGNTLQANPAWAKVMGGISWMFHKSEVINREATGMAAFRLARADGKSYDDALDYAGRMTALTQFDYSAANRPPIMQGNALRIAMQFKNYSIAMTWRFYRDLFQAFKAEDPEVRRVARRTVTGILGMTGILAGAMGLPVYSAVRIAANAANALWGDPNDPWNFDDAFHRWLADGLGETAARLIAKGPASYVTGANLADRTSMANLWIRNDNQQLEGADAYHALLESLAGPIGGIVNNYYVGTEDIRRGKLERGFERMLPTAVKNSMKAMRYAKEGVNSSRGDPILPDVSGYQDFLQAIGFEPASVANQYRANSAEKYFDTGVSNRRQNLMNAYALAVKHADGDDQQLALKRIADFNRAHPEVAITRMRLRASLRARARASAQAQNGIFVNRHLRQGAAAFAGADQ